jgi:hypothetical protein
MISVPPVQRNRCDNVLPGLISLAERYGKIISPAEVSGLQGFVIASSGFCAS